MFSMFQGAMTAAQRAEANIGRQANEQLRAVIAERDAGLQRAQEALQVLLLHALLWCKLISTDQTAPDADER